MIRARPTWIVGSISCWSYGSSSDPNATCRLLDLDITADGAGHYILACQSVDGEFQADTWHQTLDEAYSAAKESFGVDRGEWGPAIDHNTPRGVGITAIKRLIDILATARTRKHMYFSTVTPTAVEDWLSGLHTACSLAGIEWSPEARRPAIARRGLELLACWETEQLAARGLSAQEIVDELLAIEIEMWQEIERVGPSETGDGAPPVRRFSS